MGRPLTRNVWTKEEEELVLSGMTTRRIMELTGRGMQVIISKRNRMAKTHFISKRESLNNSIRHQSYHGPEGWTPDQRAPCRMCKHHADKSIQLGDGYMQLKNECKYCHARQVWAAHEGGGVPTVMEVENYDFSEPMITDYV